MEKPTKSSMTEEKKLQYDKTRQQLIKRYREEYQYAKDNNLMSERNMYFFLTILEQLKLKPTEFARLSGCSQQLINWWLLSDDVKYQNIVMSFAKIGYKLEAEFEKPKQEPKVIANVNYIISIGDKIISSPDKTKGKDVTLKAAIERNKSSAIIARMIYSLNLSINEFCKKYTIDQRLFQEQLTKERIKISLLYKLSKLTGLKIIWKLTKSTQVETPA